MKQPNLIIIFYFSRVIGNTGKISKWKKPIFKNKIWLHKLSKKGKVVNNSNSVKVVLRCFLTFYEKTELL